MGTKRRNLLSWMLLGILFSSSALPAYAEVETIQTDRLFYTLDDTIIFSGTVDNDSSGLVTIVIRDSNDEFVLLTQALINPDNTFERSVDINEKFSIHGIYNATAFLVNMTEGSLTRFDFSLDGAPINPSVMDSEKVINEVVTASQTSVQTNTESEPVSKIASFVDPTKDPQYYIDRYNNEPAYKEWFDTNFPDLTIYEAVGLTIDEEPKKIIDVSQFIDSEVEPQYYIDRYNNEPAYKEWFDTNFPDLTIYEAVGIIPEESTPKDIDKSNIIEPPVPIQESSPNLVESSAANTSIMTDTKNSEMGQMLLALGGLGILFGAVYGVKRKVDSNTEQIVKNKSILQKKVESNTEQISQNSFWLKKKLINLKQNDDPVKVIKDRLAKGEITVNEYYKLLKALKK